MLSRYLVYFCCVIIYPFNLSANDLTDHPSPYLAMHGNDPIDWMEWGEAALQKAKAEDKLIFVSIGYYACHWCHVMQRESFQNAEIAKKLNAHYISIKVDRELNPVLDQRLMDFVRQMTGHGGWPLSVFLTPDAYPFSGTTYMPPEHFQNILDKLLTEWKNKQAVINHEAKSLHHTLSNQQKERQKSHNGDAPAQLGDDFISEIMMMSDEFEGGFGSPSKFPNAAKLQALLFLNQTVHKDKKQQRQKIDDFIQLTLDQMQSQGLRDHIHGGFFRYTINPTWQTPHFEKMLYTNALLPVLYFHAAQIYQRPDYRETALDTLRFVRKSMAGKSGAYVTSLSAIDDNNVEGGFYLWSQSLLKTILQPDEQALANAAWHLDQPQVLDGGNLPVLYQSMDVLAVQFQQDKKQLAAKLTTIRQHLKTWSLKHRQLPYDEKFLAESNGLLLAAFANALPYDKTLHADGNALSQFLLKLWDGQSVQKATDKNNKSLGAGVLADYATVAWGLAQWGQAVKDDKLLHTAHAIIQTAWQRFYHKGHWLQREHSLLPEPVALSHLMDTVLPSAEAYLLAATQLILKKYPDKALEQQLNEVLQRSSLDLDENPWRYGSLLVIASEVL